MNGDQETQGVVAPRQLRIRGLDTTKEKGEKEGKEKEKPGNKWVIVMILILTIVVSLIFKFGSVESVNTDSEQVKPPSSKGSSLFGPAEFQFSK